MTGRAGGSLIAAQPVIATIIAAHNPLTDSNLLNMTITQLILALLDLRLDSVLIIVSLLKCGKLVFNSAPFLMLLQRRQGIHNLHCFQADGNDALQKIQPIHGSTGNVERCESRPTVFGFCRQNVPVFIDPLASSDSADDIAASSD